MIFKALMMVLSLLPPMMQVDQTRLLIDKTVLDPDRLGSNESRLSLAVKLTEKSFLSYYVNAHKVSKVAQILKMEFPLNKYYVKPVFTFGCQLALSMVPVLRNIF